MPSNPMVVASDKAFSSEMRTLGWIEGRNLTIEHRYHNQPGVDLARAVAELIGSKPDVLAIAGPEIVVETAARATKTIPIAMVAVNFDPIEHGRGGKPRPAGRQCNGHFHAPGGLAAKAARTADPGAAGKRHGLPRSTMRCRPTSLPAPGWEAERDRGSPTQSPLEARKSAVRLSEHAFRLCSPVGAAADAARAVEPAVHEQQIT